MSEGIKLIEKDMGEGQIKIMPAMPNGDFIPNIVKDSMVMDFDPQMSGTGIFKLRLELFVSIEELKDKNLVLFPGLKIGSL